MNNPYGPAPGTAEDILKTAYAFQRSQIVLASLHLGVFTAIGEDSLDPGEVARRINADERATDRLLSALCAVGLLHRQGGRFSNTEAGRRHLVRGKPGYLAGLGHAFYVYQSWGTLADAVRKGTRVRERGRDEDSTRAFIEAMHARAVHEAHDLANRLDLTGVKKVLDVGGGSGVYAMAMVKAKDGLTAVVFDLPEVTGLTRKYIAEAGLDHRITTMDGDYHTSEFGHGYDLVFFSAIAHINSPDQNRGLMKKAAAALNPGGRIAVQDFVMNEDRVTPARGAVFALNMLVNTQSGDTYTESEIRSWLADAGCDEITRTDTGPATAMIIGKLPE